MTLPTESVQRTPTRLSMAGDSAARTHSASALMTLLMPEGNSLPPARRLVVLVPDIDLDESALSRRIWTLAAPNKLAVLYLGLARSTPDEPHARRRLATLAALTRDDRVSVNTSLALEVDWLGALRPLLRPGDLIICHAEQMVRIWRRGRRLGSTLCQTLQVPVHLLEGFYAEDPAQPASPLGQFSFWAGSVVILASAFWLQVQISTLPKNWAESALMMLSVIAECGLIGLWSRAFN